MRVLSIIILFAFRASSQEVLISDLVRSHDTVAIYNLVKNTDQCFDTVWKLDSIKCHGLSHVSNGCLFFFHREFGNSQVKRWYAFETYLMFYDAAEIRNNSNALPNEKYGRVYFENGKLFLIERHRRKVTSDTNYIERWEETYETYEGCSLKCVYVIEGEYWSMEKRFGSKAEFDAWISKPNSDVKKLSEVCN